jgi:hypothetical protein
MFVFEKIRKHVMGKYTQAFTLYEVVKIIDLEPIIIPENVGESYKFRIEILKKYKTESQYHARVYRRETYRLQPTFPLIDGKPEHESWDHEILVVDDGQDWESCAGQSFDEVLEKVLQRIHEVFKVQL